MPGFVEIIEMSKQSITGIVYNEFDDEIQTQMHCSVVLREMSKDFYQQLKNIQLIQNDEILALEKTKCSPEQLFNILFQTKIDNISAIANAFVTRVWDYIEIMIINAFRLNAQNLYPQLFSSLKKAARNVITRQKESFKSKLFEFLGTKKMNSYKCDPEVISSWIELKENERDILDDIQSQVLFGELVKYPKTISYQAIDIKTRIVACLEMARTDLFSSVDDLDLPSMVFRMMASEMETQIVNELKSDGESRYNPMLKESPSMITRRWKLKNRIELLNKSKKVVENAIDEISFHNF